MKWIESRDISLQIKNVINMNERLVLMKHDGLQNKFDDLYNRLINQRNIFYFSFFIICGFVNEVGSHLRVY
jgi:hypothetical protein